MAGWHARARHGLAYDVWHDGRFVERWADSEFINGLRDAYSVYDPVDFQRALKETISLFRRIAGETADMLNYDYPESGDAYATKLIEDYLALK